MLGSTKIKVKLSKPVNGCNGRVYSKIQIKYPEVDLGGDFKLNTCRR